MSTKRRTRHKPEQVERELRDALASRIYSGTHEIQRTLVASLLGL